MREQRILILDKERINRKLQRMAYQIWEKNSNETTVTLVGIEGSGAVVAKSLANHLEQISPLKVRLIYVKMDKKQPLTKSIELNEDLSGCSVVLVDDVANSGKTLLYALKPLLAYEMKKIMIAVLVDRRHKSFPISPDIVGQSVSTTLQEHIKVESSDSEIIAAYLE